MDNEHLSDAYHGQYRSGAEFAENLVSDCGYVLHPYWIEIDWEKTGQFELRLFGVQIHIFQQLVIVKRMLSCRNGVALPPFLCYN